MKKSRMRNFKKGDKVEAMDDIIRGIVVEVDGGQVRVETGDGFYMWFTAAELIPVGGREPLPVSSGEIARIKGEKEVPGKKKVRVPRAKQRSLPAMEVDLHINQLVASTRNMTNFEILNLQLETAGKQIEFAIRKRIRKVVFIHGVGEGVLKEELYSLFRRYDSITYHDAEYRKYGLGATEIDFRQNT